MADDFDCLAPTEEDLNRVGLSNKVRARFWAKVDRGATDVCWAWGACLDHKGYGMFRLRNRMPHAHRIAWMLTRGAIPDGLQVLHKCDNRVCCNPAHLFLGTNAQNVADRVAKGRSNRPRGTRNPKAKLDELGVREIRRRLLAGDARSAIARAHGVSKRTVWSIHKGETWRHVA
jgi:hypothetical protein